MKRRVHALVVLLLLAVARDAFPATEVTYIALPSAGSAVLIVQQEQGGPRHGVLFDAGCPSAGCLERVKAEVRQAKVNNLWVVLSHWDLDHAGGLRGLVEAFNPVVTSATEEVPSVRGPPRISGVIVPAVPVPIQKQFVAQTLSLLNERQIASFPIQSASAQSILQQRQLRPLNERVMLRRRQPGRDGAVRFRGARTPAGTPGRLGRVGGRDAFHVA